jgi:hypothetical protein
MRSVSFLVFAVVLFSQPAVNEATVIAAVKRTPVQAIDPTAKTRQTLEAWLSTLSESGSKLTWEVNDCGEATGAAADAGRDVPMCVEARARVGQNREVIVSVVVGTNSIGVTSTRELWQATLADGAGGFRNTRHLLEMAAWVNDPHK